MRHRRSGSHTRQPRSVLASSVAHKAQLRVCHEQIAADQGLLPDEEAWEEARKQYCNLRGDLWCWDCDMYVCSIHAASHHFTHSTEAEE